MSAVADTMAAMSKSMRNSERLHERLAKVVAYKAQTDERFEIIESSRRDRSHH
jgi:hypothetical protein